MPIELYIAGSAVVGAIAGAGLGLLFAPKSVPRSAPAQVELMRNLLAFLLVSAFISVLPVLTFKAIPKENEQLLTYMLGQLSGMATMAIGFYFVNKAGQDAIDAKRADTTGKLAAAVTAAVASAPGVFGVADAKVEGAQAATEAASETVDELAAAAGALRPKHNEE